MTNRRLMLPAVLLLLLSMAPGGHAVQKSRETSMRSELIGDFVKVAPGEFRMGCLPEDRCDLVPIPLARGGGIRRQVKPVSGHIIEKGFEIGKFEVTQAQWQRVFGKNPTPAASIDPDNPVMSVSWKDVEKFLDKLNGLKDGYHYRLPTSIEWEFAARGAGAGAAAPAALPLAEVLRQAGAMGSKNAWHADNSGGRLRRVGELPPNGLGLHDMLGNVAEWVMDPAVGGSPRAALARGGSYLESALAVSAAAERFADSRGEAGVGFRLVREPLVFQIKGTVDLESKMPRPVFQFRMIDANGWKFAPDPIAVDGDMSLARQATGPFEPPRPQSSRKKDFTIQLAVGEYRAEISGLPPGFAAHSVMAGSINLLQSPLKVTGSGVPRITIVLTARPDPHARVSGHVLFGPHSQPAPPMGRRDAAGRPAPALVKIGLISPDYAEPFETSIGQNGRFDFPGIPPGVYQPFFPGRGAVMDRHVIEVRVDDIHDLTIPAPPAGCVICSGAGSV